MATDSATYGRSQGRQGIVTPHGYKISTRYTHRQLATMIGATEKP